MEKLDRNEVIYSNKRYIYMHAYISKFNIACIKNLNTSTIGMRKVAKKRNI